MRLTPIFNLYFGYRQHLHVQYATQGDDIQKEQLRYLLETAQNTEIGGLYGFHKIKTYDDFANRVPVTDYEGLKPYVDRMLRGENRLIWPSKIKWFAKSSGTTNDKSKFIPVSDECLKKCHYQGGFDVVATYFRNYPHNKFFGGKSLVLGGSHAINPLSRGISCGDLSAILLQNSSMLVNMLRVPPLKIAIMDEWEAKIKAIVKDTIHRNVVSLSGVPSWMMTLIKQILQESGAQNLCEVWPNLEAFFHGGISFDPYRQYYKELIPSEKMHYVEIYNASEGFFGMQDDPAKSDLLLMLDLGVFFEFMPLNELDKDNPKLLPLWEIKAGENYALVLSSTNGLWRYLIGDTVKITSTSPVKFTISGRTKHFINAFGEELMVANAEKGISKACEATGSEVINYSVAPIFMSDKRRGCHQWLIEFEKMPANLDAFADILDKALQEVNSDYEAKRYKGIFLDRLEVIVAKPHLFDDWLREKGKLGGQHKIPRLSNDRILMEELLKMNK
ncbi:MAG: GH3 auxin-responsive promoter family protein [Porphyromonadaceae bacterium]|nr:GH3 auxin-responsive promoter family protein [Porphyromonadaceae bacterium]